MDGWILSGKKIDKTSVANVVRALREMEVAARYDEFSRNLKIRGVEETGLALNRLAYDVEMGFGFCPSPKIIRRGLLLTAVHENPAQIWLRGLKWDGKDRLGQLGEIFDCPDVALNREGLRLIFRGVVSRSLGPGIFFKYMPILKGAQNAGKSSALKIIGGDYYVEGPEFNAFQYKKDLVDKVRGKWLVEQEELAGMQRADRNKLKAAISQTHDTVRLSYGEKAETFPRQFIMVGTANEVPLTDATGNVRFVVVDVGKVDLERLKKEREQLFAQAVVEHRQGEIVELPNDVWEQQAERNEQERVLQDVEVVLEEYTRGKTWVTASAVIAETVGAYSTPSLVKVIMEKLGFHQTRKRIHNKQERGWQRDSDV